MARTHGQLYDAICEFGSLLAAYRRARRGKRQREAVQHFEQDLEGNLLRLQRELRDENYQVGRYHVFQIYEPKPRAVAALPFRDRIAQHSLVAQLEPIFERGFIADSYACRPGRGLHRGADRAQAMLRAVKRQYGRLYVLKADVASYFASVDHQVLMAMLARKIRCQRTLKLCQRILDSHGETLAGRRVGMPIGNLTSQLFANIYLNALDQFVKRVLKWRHYLRYMDDFVLIGPDKAQLHAAMGRVRAFLAERLRLQLNRKTQVFPVALQRGRGLDYLGYRLWPTHRRLRKASIARMAYTLRRSQRDYWAGRLNWARLRARIQSWLAHASHAQTWGLRWRLLGAFPIGGPRPMGARA